jgi:hypothetical protein
MFTVIAYDGPRKLLSDIAANGRVIICRILVNSYIPPYATIAATFIGYALKALIIFRRVGFHSGALS